MKAEVEQRHVSAFKVFDENGKISGRIVRVFRSTSVSEGAVVIKAAFSSVNYKDALAATGTGRIIRRLPWSVASIFAGTVESSADTRFKVGDPALVTGYDLGVAHDGGYRRLRSRPGGVGGARPEGAVGARRDGARHCRLHRGAVGDGDGTQRLDARQRPGDRHRRHRRRRQHRRAVPPLSATT